MPLRFLTISRITNFLAASLAYLLSILTGRPVVWGQPSAISIEPVAVCNLSCPHCPAGNGNVRRNHPVIDPALFRCVIDQAAPYAGYLMLYFQGEPLLHKQFFDLVAYAGSKRIYTVTATNGQLITAEVAQKLVASGLNELIISMDGARQDSYSAYRIGGDIEKLKDGIRFLASSKKEQNRYFPRIIIQCIVFRHNQRQLDEIKRMARELGADRVRFKSAQLYPVPGAMDLLPDEKRFRRYHVTGDGKLIMRRRLLNRCRRIWQTAVITSDGDLVPCCFDKEASWIMGSLKEQSLEKIWKSDEYKSFRNQILKGRKEVVICRNCTGGLGRTVFR
jgi:radical SAM protein with 4Fe4S-binding SPASM domain